LRFINALALPIVLAVVAGACGGGTGPGAQGSPTSSAAGANAKPVVKFPDGKPITMIVPWDAGGATDVGARILAAGLEKELGTRVEVVNRGGAASQVGVTELSKAAPTGYTIGFTNLPSSMTPYLDASRNAAYNRQSLAQIANQVFDPEVLAIKSDSRFKTLNDLITEARAKPDSVRISVAGIGSDGHFGFLLLQQLAGIRLKMVTSSGSPETFQFLLGGHVDGSILTLGNFGSKLKSGEFRFLGVMDKQRSPFVKDVPTFEEQGVKAYMASTRGVSAPAGVPQEILDVLSSGIDRAMKSPEVQAKMDALALAQRYLGPKEYADYWKDFESTVIPLLELIKKQQ